MRWIPITSFDGETIVAIAPCGDGTGKGASGASAHFENSPFLFQLRKP
jgi:hypothetical protein